MGISVILTTLVLSYNIFCYDQRGDSSLSSSFRRNKNKIYGGSPSSSESSFSHNRDKIDKFFKKSGSFRNPIFQKPFSYKRQQSNPGSYWFNTKTLGMKRDNSDEDMESSSSSTISENSFLQPQRYHNIYNFDDYASEHFRSERKGLFKLKKIPGIERAKYSNKPLRTSLTKISKTKDARFAITISNLIKNYQKYGQPRDIDRIIEILKKNPDLYDEAYSQLISQTKENTQSNYEMSTWEILLVLTSIFPSTKESEPYIKSYLLKRESEENEFSKIAQLCYIRFSVRCYFGIKKENLENALAILTKFRHNIPDFYGSIYEYLWFQRETYPDLTIPYIIKDMADAILNRMEIEDSDELLGVFRVAAVQNIPNNFIRNYEMGDSNFREEIPLKELCYLFTRWLRNQIPLIPDEIFTTLINARNPKEFLNIIIDNMDPTNLNLFGYVIGFFRDVHRFSEITKMEIDGLVRIIIPNVMKLDSYNSYASQGMEELKAIDKKLQAFFSYIVTTWDTTQYYP